MKGATVNPEATGAPFAPSGEPAPSAIEVALQRARRVLEQSQRPDGSWDRAGRIGPWMTAQAVVVLAHLSRLPPDDAAAAARWLRAQQRPDGSFLLHPFAREGSLGATACGWAALHVTKVAENADAIARARAWIDHAGGEAHVIEAMDQGDLAAVYLSLAGLVDARRLPCPTTAPLLLGPVLRLMQTRFHTGVFQMAFELAVLLRRLRGDWGPDGGRKGLLGKLTCRQLVRLLEPFQNPDGSWNDSTVITVMTLPALWAAGIGPEEPILARGISWLESQKVVDADGLHFDGFGTEVWSTAFDARALLESGSSATDSEVRRSIDWLVDAQLHVPMPKVDNRKAGAPLSGGWAFQRSNPTMPDCDDTAVTLSALGMALRTPSLDPALEGRWRRSADQGREWLLGMQNPDGGWSAFVWGLPGKRPGPTLQTTPSVRTNDPWAMLRMALDPPASMGDPSTEDVTARVLHGLGQLGDTAASSPPVARAIEFLRRQQCDSGAWWGRWVVNYLSATAFVLMGAAAVGVDTQESWIRRAVQWVLSRQNPDGGWGEGPGSYRDESLAGVGESMPPLTGLVLQGLIDAGERESTPVRRGVAYLLKTQHPDGTWPNGKYLHTNVPPDTFYLYPEAARFYPTEALGKYSGCRVPLSPTRWTDELLDAMRQTADTVADAVVADVFQRGSVGAVNDLLANIFRSDEPIPSGLPEATAQYFEDTAALPRWADPAQLAVAQALFSRCGWFIAAGLFCSSLPQAYAAAHGAHVLVQTQGMTRHVRQRIFETAQFLFDVLDEGALAPGGRGIRAAQRVRLMHAGIRHLLLSRPSPAWPSADRGLPVNQEDLAGTLMTFSIVILDALRLSGMSPSREEAEAWLHHWKVIGHLLGIHPTLLPDNVAEGTQLMDAIRTRQWAASADGRVLVGALLGMMQGYFLGSPLKALPAALVRRLAGDHCADLLGVPASEWSHVLDDAAEALELVEGAAGLEFSRSASPTHLFAYAAHLLMKGIVLAEREGKQAKFRIPTALLHSVDPSF